MLLVILGGGAYSLLSKRAPDDKPVSITPPLAPQPPVSQPEKAPTTVAPTAPATPAEKPTPPATSAPSKTDTQPFVGIDSGAIFAPDSFWYTPIPANAPLHPDSAHYVTEILRQKKAYYGTVSINTHSYSSPVFIATKDTPTVRVAFWDCQHKGHPDPNLEPQWSAVPIPAEAEQAEGTDAEMTIYQPSSDTLWEFWQARKVDGKWQACWGGRMQHVSKNPGYWEKYYGTTASGLPFLGGQITAEELQRGEIKHALGFSLVDAEDSKIFSWPANRSDGSNKKKEPYWICEGQRFRLDPSINVDALKMHPVGKVIAKAAQKYGFVVWDKAGALTLRAQNSKSYTRLGLPDPYAALFNKTPAYAILANFPWEKLQFLPKDYGKPDK